MALTRITKGVIKPNENYDTHNINSTGIVTAIGLDINGNADVSGSLSVGGVLTYEDVTSIDSVGIITAQKDIHVGAGISVVGVGTFGNIVVGAGGSIAVGTGITFETNGQGTFSGITTSRGYEVNGYSDGGGNYNYFKAGRLKIYDNGSHIHINGTYSAHLYDHSSTRRILTNDFLMINTASSRYYIRTQNSTGVVDLYYGGASNHGIKLSTSEKGITVGAGVTIETNGQATFAGITTFSDNVNIGGVVTVTGAVNASHSTFGNLNTTGITIQNTNASINFTDTNNNPDYSIIVDGGVFDLNSVTPAVNIIKINTDGHIDVNTNVDFAADIDVDGHTNLDNVSIAGVTTMSGNLTISNSLPQVYLQDTDHNSDYAIWNHDGTFRIVDATNSNATRLSILSDGTTSINNTLNVNTRLNVGATSVGFTPHTTSWATGAALNLKGNFGGGITFNDNDNNGFSIYVESSGNNFHIKNGAVGGSLKTSIKCVKDGTVELHHNGSTKLDTRSGGVGISGDIFLVDSSRVYLGSSNDFYLFHDTTNSNIVNSTGNLVYRSDTHHFKDKDNGDTHAKFIHDGAVELYHDNDKKIQTTSTGAQIDTILKLYGAAGNPGRLRLQEGGALCEIMCARNTDTSSFLYFKTEISGTTATRAVIDESGHFRPFVDSQYDLGITGTRWRNVYADTLYGNGANLTGIDTDLVSDTSPQLGADLDVNNFDIKNGNQIYEIVLNQRHNFKSAGNTIMNINGNGVDFQHGNNTHADGVESRFGTGNDLKIFHNGSNSAVQNSQGALYIQNTATNSTDLHLQAKSSIKMHCPSDGTERLTVFNNGAVKIGDGVGSGGGGLAIYGGTVNQSSGQDAALYVRHDSTADWGMWLFKQHEYGFRIDSNSSATLSLAIYDQSSNLKHQFKGNGDYVASGAVDSTSDIKLKTNIKTIDSALDKVLQLRGAEYDRIDKDNQHEIGVIAQEVEKVIPEVVHGDETKSVSYGNMVAVLIEAIKEQNDVINKMKKEIEDLKG